MKEQLEKRDFFSEFNKLSFRFREEGLERAYKRNREKSKTYIFLFILLLFSIIFEFQNYICASVLDSDSEYKLMPIYLHILFFPVSFSVTVLRITEKLSNNFLCIMVSIIGYFIWGSCVMIYSPLWGGSMYIILLEYILLGVALELGSSISVILIITNTGIVFNTVFLLLLSPPSASDLLTLILLKVLDTIILNGLSIYLFVGMYSGFHTLQKQIWKGREWKEGYDSLSVGVCILDGRHLHFYNQKCLEYFLPDFVNRGGESKEEVRQILLARLSEMGAVKLEPEGILLGSQYLLLGARGSPTLHPTTPPHADTPPPPTHITKIIRLKLNMCTLSTEYPQKYILCITEITSIAKAESARMELKYKNILNTTINHQFRTLLGALTPTIYNMEKYLSEVERGKKALNVAKNICKLLDYGLLDILDYSNLKTGALNLTTSNFQLLEAIQDCFSTVEFEAHEKNLNLQLIESKTVPVVFEGDERRFKQILINLLINGIKFTEKGGIRVEVRTAEIYGIEALIISIRDTGIGIKSTYIPTLFSKPFGSCRAQNQEIGGDAGGEGNIGDVDIVNMSHSSEGGGRDGLWIGLYVCRKLIEEMGGGIECRSTDGVGSTFTLWLPINLEDSTVIMPLSTSHIPPPPQTNNNGNNKSETGEFTVDLECSDNHLEEELAISPRTPRTPRSPRAPRTQEEGVGDSTPINTSYTYRIVVVESNAVDLYSMKTLISSLDTNIPYIHFPNIPHLLSFLHLHPSTLTLLIINCDQIPHLPLGRKLRQLRDIYYINGGKLSIIGMGINAHAWSLVYRDLSLLHFVPKPITRHSLLNLLHNYLGVNTDIYTANQA